MNEGPRMHHTRREADDVRMRGFAQRHTVDAALAWLDAQLQPLTAEMVSLPLAAGRVPRSFSASNVDVPDSIGMMMIRYSESTEGASA
jgi:hypothetical protein